MRASGLAAIPEVELASVCRPELLIPGHAHLTPISMRTPAAAPPYKSLKLLNPHVPKATEISKFYINLQIQNNQNLLMTLT